MADSDVLSIQNSSCTLTPTDVVYDFGDVFRFRKIEFPEETGITANSLVQLFPDLAASKALSQTYVLSFPHGIQGALMELKQGGLSTVMVDTSGRFTGTASLHQIDPAAIAMFQTFRIASFATGQYFLADISSKMSEINRKLDEVMAFLQTSKRTELASEFTFVKYALENYSTIMLSEPQRTATIGNLQRSKIRAIADMDFYTTELERHTSAKDALKEPQLVVAAKRNFDLASQLYAISTVMEAYYAQNWNECYIKNICEESKQLLGRSKNLISNALSPYAKDIRDANSKKNASMINQKIKGISIPFTDDEQKILEISDELANQIQHPLVNTINNALRQPFKESELCLSNGAVYQKIC